MTKFLAKSRYLIFIAVFGLLVTALAAFTLGVLNTWDAAALIVTTLGRDPEVTVLLLEVVDSFLVATTLMLFALSLYELFIADLNVPEWMVAHNLHDLKARLSSLIVLVMAVKFVEKLAESKDAQSLLLTGIAVAVVSAALIAFSYLGAKD